MPVTKIHLEVVMDGNSEHTVEADQRDMAAWEAYPDAERLSVHTHMRHLAWTAMVREGLTTATWTDFNERKCVQASMADDEKPEGEQSLSPGQTEAGGGSTSSQPAARVSRSPRS